MTDTLDSDVNALNGQLTFITGLAGQNNHGLDIGYARIEVSLGNIVWYDTNNNGIRENSETRIPGVTVALYQDTNGDGDFDAGIDTFVRNTTTSATGFYSFTNLLPTTGITSTYLVVIPNSNFGGVLAGYRNSNGNDVSGSAPDVDLNSTDSDDNGDEIGAYYTANFVVSSKAISLTLGGEPISESGGNGGSDPLPDPNSNLTVDFGFYRLELGNRVWLDANQNGIHNGAEIGFSGVAVALLNNSGVVISTTSTNASGFYTFTGLIAGNYSVSITAPSGFVSSIPYGGDPDNNIDSDDNGQGNGGNQIVSQQITLVPGSEPTNIATMATSQNGTVDFGLWQPMPSIALTKFTNGQDADVPTGPTIAAGSTVTWTYRITNTGNVTLTNVVLTDNKLTAQNPLTTGVTLAPGASILVTKTGIATAGQYSNTGTVTGTNPYSATGMITPTVTVTNPSHYFGQASLTASLGDYVWEDLNHDGQQNDGNTGVNGVAVALLNSSNQVISTTTTFTGGPSNQPGYYTFTNLISGTYHVSFTLPAGYQWTTANNGSDTTDSDGVASGNTAVTGNYALNTGQSTSTVDQGLWRPASLGDYVWEDINRDGIQNPEETGVPSVTVTL